ncbi:MAG: TldD/PmbA family protein [Planctomycetota bacterium]|nr:TldD/PmbA family protein [Planctomycetota bacterium]
MLDVLERRFRAAAPKVDRCSLRFMQERHEQVSVRQDVVQPVQKSTDAGVMVTVVDKGGMGYAATSDLSEAGLRRAFAQAAEWARRTAGKLVLDVERLPAVTAQGEYASPVARAWETSPLPEKVDLLRGESARLKVDPRIVDWEASLWSVDVETLLLSSEGGRIHQRLRALMPGMHATAAEGVESQTRTFGGHAFCRQGGLEVLDQFEFRAAAPRIGREALELLGAPDCPSGAMDLLLAPDQMILQIHESIGHPLELDRILGDERNYAGTSFVTPDMFGTYQYGSKLLNVTFDPTRPEQLASYGFDDEGTPARREFVIKDGLLLRPLGGRTSQARAGLEGVANARSMSWNRPPIDRMANLNVEPGTSSFEDMVKAVERGVFMETNCSWSIDDSRNKFQFGCERGRLIEDGELTKVVKKPNYRGISATFWRNLKMVGDERTFLVMGTPNCGKGEPNQVIRVGHATPACLFAGVDVFGGA